MSDHDPNRKTNLPIRGISGIVEWLMANCTVDEIYFMADLARDRRKFALLTSILTRLTEHNIYEVFYTGIQDITELAYFRAAKRGEVAGLKAFAKACQVARETINEREDEKKKDKKVN